MLPCKHIIVLFGLLTAPSFHYGQMNFEPDSINIKHAGTKPDTAYCYAYVNRISDIDLPNEQYRIEIWFLVSYRNPYFDFEKQLVISGAKKTEIVTVSKGRRKGLISVKLRVSCTISQNWDTQAYPFDGQHLDLEVYNAVYDSRQLVLMYDKPEIHNDTTLTMDNGWKLKKDTITFTRSSVPLDEVNPHVVLNYDIDIIRLHATWIFFKLFIGMYVAFAVAYLAFFIHVENVEPRFGLPVGALFAAIANKYIVESMLPQTPNFTIVDSLHAITFLFIFLIIGLSVGSLKHLKYTRELNQGSSLALKLERMDRRGRLIVLVTYILLNIICIYWSYVS